MFLSELINMEYDIFCFKCLHHQFRYWLSMTSLTFAL